jgi:predicted MFS family arabinose efflux permease
MTWPADRRPKAGGTDGLIETRSEKINRWKFAIIFYVAILFGGVILADIAISEVFNLTGEAAQSLTEISLKVALAVAVLGGAFARRRLTLKTTLVTTAVFSVGLFLWVLWIRNGPR